MRRMWIVLSMITLILTPILAFAETDFSIEEEMSWEQFTLIEAQEPVIPRSPFVNNYSPEEDNDAQQGFQEWWLAKFAQQETNVTYLAKIHSFTKNSARSILSDNVGLNTLYSPINTWFYLELLSNITEGNSRAQVLNLLGFDTESETFIEDGTLYKALYWDDGFSILRPSSSIWINQNTNFSDALLSKLSTSCHTSVFQGPMGEDVYNEAFRTWINKQTNDLLKEAVDDLGFDRETVISLCTSLYIRSLWSLPFNKDETYTDVFYSAGGETTADYMRKEEGGAAVYHGENFSSVIMDLQDGSYVTFVLPDSESNIENVLQSDEFFDFLFSGIEWPIVKKGRIRISIPKADILSAISLEDILTSMGTIDIFNSENVEYSKDIISADKLKLSSAEQYSRLIMNENGIEAASIIVSDSALFRIPNEEEIDFILNRPFIFAVFSETNIPLFIGEYNAP